MDAFTPFGGGPRFCPGKNLAILEIRMVLSMLFKNFNIEMVTDHKDVHEIMAFVMMSSGFKVRLTPRNRN
ncbi:MAG: cytochrome P450 [Crocinitomicaceae bacterium]|nr:cytochrome P450 [Crocinitomicaceae bacterium]